MVLDIILTHCLSFVPHSFLYLACLPELNKDQSCDCLLGWGRDIPDGFSVRKAHKKLEEKFWTQMVKDIVSLKTGKITQKEKEIWLHNTVKKIF